jgi:glycosyltransferase involved in cell wall biosynthesis
MDITVVVASIPQRHGAGGPYERAIASLRAQTFKPVKVRVVLDQDGLGAAATRNRALAGVTTEYCAFLDDDDELYPNHLKLLARCARLTGADVVYPGYDADEDLVNCFGLPYDADMLQRTNFIPVTTLCRTEKILAAGGFQEHPDVNGDPCEDWGLWLAMAGQGASFVHLPVRTWRWHPGGTKGRPDR